MCERWNDARAPVTRMLRWDLTPENVEGILFGPEVIKLPEVPRTRIKLLDGAKRLA